MSRRDTIIIAVLVNVGLLTILFATATHSDSEQELSSQSEVLHPAPTTAAPEPALDPVQLQRHFSASVEKREQKELLSPSRRAVSQPIRAMAAPSQPVQRVAVKKESQATPVASGRVRVKQGDVLSKIAQAHGTTVQELMEVNQLTSTRLKVGQELKLPLRSPRSLERKVSEAPASKEGELYTVQAGDSPWSIARRHGVSLERLLQLNELNDESARRLKPGDALRIR